MKLYPNLMTLSMLENVNSFQIKTKTKDGWVPVRPLGLASVTNRVRLAWGVFTGRYDALQWPGGQ